MSTAEVGVARVVSPAERAAFARAVLTRAERRTGTATWTRRPPVSVPGRVDLVDLAEGGDLGIGTAGPTPHPAARTALDLPPEHVPLDPGSGARVLPVHPSLAGLLPSGALDRGATLVVGGSTSLVLALLAEASRAGSWTGLVGLPRVGVLAAHQLGLDLARVVLVPAPGPDGPTVLAALVDGVDVVVVGDVALTDTDRRRLSARVRERGAVLVSTTPWPGAHVALTAEVARWEGLGRGEGRLRTRRLTVRGSGRGAAARGWSTEVVVPPQDEAPEMSALLRPVPGPAERGAGVRGPWAGRRAG